MHDVPAYSFWETYIKNGLSEAGHSWVEAQGVDWAKGLACHNKQGLDEWKGATWQCAIDQISALHERSPIDLFLSYLFPWQVEAAAIKRIQHLGIPCVNFFCDNVREFTRVPPEFNCFDLHWVPEKNALALYRRAGLRHVYAPMPVFVPIKSRTCVHPETHGFTFCGSRDVTREALLEQVLSMGIEIEIRGPGWLSSEASSKEPRRRSFPKLLANQWADVSRNGVKAWVRRLACKLRPSAPPDFFDRFVHPARFGDEYLAILQQSCVTLGVNRYPSFRHPLGKPDTYSRLRDIEAPMLGACYLTEWAEGLDDLFDPGVEIEIYRDASEMAEQLRKLKAHRSLRDSLRCKGQRRALANHSIGSSMLKVSSSLR